MSRRRIIDEIDKRIIEMLQQDGRRPFTQIARDLGLSEAGVRQRVQSLIEEKVMQVVAVTDPLMLGFQLFAMIGIRADGGRLIEIAETIARFDEVSYLLICTGAFDMLAEVVCEDNEHLLRFLTEKLYCVEGVQRGETFVYLRVYKQTYQWGTR
jgi:Lrp/AsnC family transcriptional regulator for asnA, asnC and gidA